MGAEQDTVIQVSQDNREVRDHIIGSVDLLIFTSLLILVVLTIWLFKHRRFPYIHETGLAIIYGAIFGLIIRYGFYHSTSEPLFVYENITDLKHVPDKIYMQTSNTSSQVFVYSYKGPKSINRVGFNSSAIRSEDFQEKATFDPEIFFNVLLPPIIFNAGYGMKRRHFFKNFGGILLFAIVGTIISSFSIGGFMYIVSFIFRLRDYVSFTDCLQFGAIISATDPVTVLAIFNDRKVDNDLYALIFGESVLNDAVAIVLSQAIDKYSGATTLNGDTFDMHQFFLCIRNIFAVFFGAFAIGSSMGCATALLTKFTYIRQHPQLETALFILMSYTTFLASEAAGFTGIVSCLFCGIFQAHYTFNNLSRESQVQTKEIFHLLNFLTENFIFIYIGITLLTFGNHQWQFSFIFASIIAIFLSRALNVYPISFFINLTRPVKRQVTRNMQHVIFFSGLRGAMAFALAIRNTSTKARQLILTTTAVIVILTVLVCGGLTETILNLYGKRESELDNNNENITLTEETDGSFNEIKFQRRAIQGRFKKFLSKFGVFRIWHDFDNRFMKPFLTNHRPNLMETMPRCCLPFTRLLTTSEQLIETNLLDDVQNNPFKSVANSSRRTLNQTDETIRFSNNQVVFSNNHNNHGDLLQMDDIELDNDI